MQLRVLAQTFARLEASGRRVAAVHIVADLFSRVAKTDLEAVVCLLQGRLRPAFGAGSRASSRSGPMRRIEPALGATTGSSSSARINPGCATPWTWSSSAISRAVGSAPRSALGRSSRPSTTRARTGSAPWRKSARGRRSTNGRHCARCLTGMRHPRCHDGWTPPSSLTCGSSQSWWWRCSPTRSRAPHSIPAGGSAQREILDLYRMQRARAAP